MSFSPLPDHELCRLADERLIDYIRQARDAGQPSDARRGLMLLVYGYERDVKRRVSLKLAAHLVDDVAHDALVRAIAAAFDGSSSGEFRGWLHTIVDRTIADHYRRAQRRPAETILPSEHSGPRTPGERSRRLTATPARSSCGSSSTSCSTRSATPTGR